MLIFGALHLVALAVGAVLFYLFLRAETTVWGPPDDDEPGGGGGGNDRVPDLKPKRSPPGGVPLPDAEQSSRRLRGPGRLGGDRARPDRRPAHAPVRTPSPERSPTRR